MEKGNAKNSSSKSNGSESKNKQDNAHKPRFQRQKDNNISPRPDNRNKFYPQRRESADRPRNRNGAVCEKYWSQVDLGIDDSPHRRKGKANLNHLLNFTLAPTEHWDKNTRRLTYNRPKFPKYNKELFLQANYQFVVRENGDYKINQKNPDILVDWSLIEEILVPYFEMPLCPICLHQPVAAKITRCGHVYCWPCMLHYLALTDKTWQKCPICFDAVQKEDLKSVSWQVRLPYTVGNTITVNLMKREKGSLLVVPVTQQQTPQGNFKINDESLATRFQKLLLACQREVQLIINREKVELQDAFNREKTTPEACFIESALKLLEEREESFHIIKSNPDCNSNEDFTLPNLNNLTRKPLTSISSTDSFEDNSNTDLMKSSPISLNLPSTIQSPVAESDAKGFSYFYQSEDGQHIFLQNINIRMLIKEFGSLEFAPSTISARIVEVERVSMTEALRKRLRYLLHLPLTCEFQIMELDFHHIVSKATFQQFEGEIQKRKMQRNKKVQEENKREKLIEVEENKKLGKYPGATYNLNSADQFPAYNPEDFISLSPPKHDHGATACYISEDQNSNDLSLMNNKGVSGNDNMTHEPTASFALMLKDGPKNFSYAMKENKTVAKPHQPTASSENEDGMLPAPNYRMSFGDAIQAALDSVTLQDLADTNRGSSKKKKKGKKQLLFTTAMCRSK